MLCRRRCQQGLLLVVLCLSAAKKISAAQTQDRLRRRSVFAMIEALPGDLLDLCPCLYALFLELRRPRRGHGDLTLVTMLYRQYRRLSDHERLCVEEMKQQEEVVVVL